MWLYDADFNPIVDAGNDDESVVGGGSGTTSRSRLTRTLGVGTYILAIGNSNVANNLASPIDDDVRSGNVMAFPNALATSATSSISTLNFAIVHSGGTITQAAVRRQPYAILFYTFNVAPSGAPLLANCNATPTATVVLGDSVTLSTNVTWTNAPGGVTADLSAFGLSNAVPMMDNGGGNFSTVLNVPSGQIANRYPVAITATDATGLTNSCSFPLTVVLPIPTNDLCAGAPVVNVGRSAATGDNSGATTTDDRIPSCGTAIQSVWFDFTAPQRGRYIFDTEGSAQVDTTLTAYAGCEGTALACDDDSGTDALSRFELDLTAGQNIKLMLSTASTSAPGGYVLNIIPPPTPPSNDICSGAKTVLLGPVAAVGDNSTASTPDDRLSTCAVVSQSVWFDFTATRPGTYIFDTEGSTQIATVLTAFMDCSAGAAQLGCNSSGGTGLLSSLALPLAAGQNIKLMLSTARLAGSGGGYVLNIAPPPCVTIVASPVDAFACVGMTVSFSTTATAPEAPIYQWEMASSVAGPYAPVADGVITGLGLIAGTNSAVLSISGVARPSNPVYFRTVVSNPCGNETSAAASLIVVGDCPSNDTCATALPAMIGTTFGDNTGATDVGDVVPRCQTASTRGVWYAFRSTSPVTTVYAIDTEGSIQADTILTAESSCNFSFLPTCDDNGGNSPANSSAMLVTVFPDLILRIQVSSRAGVAPGPFALNIAQCVTFLSEPAGSAVAYPGESVSITTTAIGTGVIIYAWQWKSPTTDIFVPLEDAPVDGLGVVSGARTPALTIANVAPAAQFGLLRCVVSNVCGSATTRNCTVSVLPADTPRCNAADIAFDNGLTIERARIIDGTHGTPPIFGWRPNAQNVNTGVTEADYNVFFVNFFDAYSVCDIANDDGTSRLPRPLPGTVINNGVTEGDYNHFFSVYFNGCTF